MKADTLKKGSNNQGVQVIARAADILRVLKQNNAGQSLGQIAEAVGLPRSTVQRIVNALLAERLVMTTSAEGGLRLGPEIQSLAAAGRIDIVELARPVLAELARTTGETVDLALLRDNHMVFVDQVVGTQRLRTVSAVGGVFPLTTTANGKAALASLDEESAAALAARELREADAAGKSLSEVIAEIEQVRDTGVAFDLDEHTEGISAVGASFAVPTGLVYAISIPVPSQRFAARKDALATDLLAAVEKVRTAL